MVTEASAESSKLGACGGHVRKGMWDCEGLESLPN